MPYCNTCGAEVANLANFCPKCGARNPTGAAAAPGSSPPPAVQTTGMSAGVKIFLGVIAAIFIICVAGIIVLATFVHRHTRVVAGRNGTSVTTPFGSFEASQSADSDTVAQRLGIPIYPGARPGRSSVAQMMGNRVVQLQFTSDDPPQKIIDFYNDKFPDSTVRSRSTNELSIVGHDGSTTTVAAHERGDGTAIMIASVQHR